MYHIPEYSPLFRPLPHSFKECTRARIICRGSKDVLAKMLPWPLSLESDIMIISWLKMGSAGGHPHIHNLSFNLLCGFDGKLARHCALEYIDSDMGLAVGREVMAYPKKGAVIIWTNESNSFEFVARRGEAMVSSKMSVAESAAEYTSWPAEIESFASAPILQVGYLPAEGTMPARAHILEFSTTNVVVGPSRPLRASIDWTSGAWDDLSFLRGISILSADIQDQAFDVQPHLLAGTRLLPERLASF